MTFVGYTLLSRSLGTFPQVITETSTRNTRETRFPANVAQLVEQLTRNEQVAGSSPAVGSLPFWPQMICVSGVLCNRIPVS